MKTNEKATTTKFSAEFLIPKSIKFTLVNNAANKLKARNNKINANKK